MGSISQVKTGTYTGTGAAQTITTGFRPKCVLMFNQTDGDTLSGHIDGMTDATAFTSAAAVAAAANAVTLTSRGFTLGTDASVNENAKVFVYVAFN
jgi:hypothetical protein